MSIKVYCMLLFCWKYFVPASGTEVNLALNKPAYQSSVQRKKYASLAVDGNYGTIFWDDKTCTHTQTEASPGEWWVVDLQGVHSVERVSITNRGDPCCGDKLADFYIRVGQDFDEGSFDPSTYTLCHYQETPVCRGETRMFVCDDPIEGRFVTIHFPETRIEILTLCEVEVFEARNYLAMTYTLYRGPDKSYHILNHVTATCEEECVVKCEQNKACDAVKVNQVTGTGNKQCLLLANPYPCETVIMITMTYEK